MNGIDLWETLPNELLLLLVSLLEPQSTGKLIRTCKYLNARLQHESVWNQLYAACKYKPRSTISHEFCCDCNIGEQSENIRRRFIEQFTTVVLRLKTLQLYSQLAHKIPRDDPPLHVSYHLVIRKRFTVSELRQKNGDTIHSRLYVPNKGLLRPDRTIASYNFKDGDTIECIPERT